MPASGGTLKATRHASILRVVDALRQHDVETARRTPPEEKLRQALELMDAGLELKRQSLRARHPEASAEELDKLFLDWLCEND